MPVASSVYLLSVHPATPAVPEYASSSKVNKILPLPIHSLACTHFESMLTSSHCSLINPFLLPDLWSESLTFSFFSLSEHSSELLWYPQACKKFDQISWPVILCYVHCSCILLTCYFKLFQPRGSCYEITYWWKGQVSYHFVEGTLNSGPSVFLSVFFNEELKDSSFNGIKDISQPTVLATQSLYFLVCQDRTICFISMCDGLWFVSKPCGISPTFLAKSAPGKEAHLTNTQLDSVSYTPRPLPLQFNLPMHLSGKLSLLSENIERRMRPVDSSTEKVPDADNGRLDLVKNSPILIWETRAWNH